MKASECLLVPGVCASTRWWWWCSLRHRKAAIFSEQLSFQHIFLKYIYLHMYRENHISFLILRANTTKKESAPYHNNDRKKIKHKATTMVLASTLEHSPGTGLILPTSIHAVKESGHFFQGA